MVDIKLYSGFSCWGVFTLLFLTACNTPASDFKQKTGQYFDLNGLLNKQVSLLQNSAVIKTSRLNAESAAADEKAVTFNEKDLHLFYEADINKPAWAGVFLVDSLVDAHGKSVIYKASNTEVNVKELQVDYTLSGKLARVSSLLSDDNMLYTSQRKMSLFFDTTAVNPLLKSYEIAGFQKIILKDTMNYHIALNLVAR